MVMTMIDDVRENVVQVKLVANGSGARGIWEWGLRTFKGRPNQRKTSGGPIEVVAGGPPTPSRRSS